MLDDQTNGRQRQKQPRAAKRVSPNSQVATQATQDGGKQSQGNGELSTGSSLIAEQTGIEVLPSSVPPRVEAKSIKRLTAKRWPLSRRAMRNTVERVVELLELEDPRTAIAAARTLVMMNGQNITADQASNNSSPSATVNVQVNVAALSVEQLAAMRAARQVLATTAKPAE